MGRKILFIVFIGFFLLTSCGNQKGEKSESETKPPIWSTEKASEWREENGWLRGCNFNPSTAINQLEMWQSDTFDPETIDRELGWAAAIGMNCMRVYLHHVAWDVDREGFKERMDQYLQIADSHGIKTIFVFFDDCWNATWWPVNPIRNIHGMNPSPMVRNRPCGFTKFSIRMVHPINRKRLI
jgi:hypothetical protein